MDGENRRETEIQREMQLCQHTQTGENVRVTEEQRGCVRRISNLQSGDGWIKCIQFSDKMF